jgi:hypothetical protein
MSVAAQTPGAPRPSRLDGGSRQRRRKALNQFMMGLSTLAAVIAIAALVLVIVDVVIKAAPAISWDFLTKVPSSNFLDPSAGGIANSIVGSAILIALSSVISIPIGILVAIYTNEFARPQVSSVIRFALDILNGVPTIVTGIFIYGLLVIGHQQSGWAGALGLAIVELPIVARAGPELTEGGGAGARPAPLADRDARGGPDGDGRPDHRRRARHRPSGGGDRAAAVHDLGLLQPCDHYRSEPSPAEHPCHDLPALGVGDAVRSREGVGGGAGADRVRADRVGGGPDLQRPQPPQAQRLTSRLRAIPRS